mmetsp:Transcript_2830/g.2353  ORF Transcript_2830/g.2353 Transcript_2830/m.2353 type:complete len:124 (+) Transcript_2830:276-647(+)
MFKNILNHEPDFPDTISAEAQDLIERLIEKDPEYRLGSNEEDAEDIMKHEWFKCIDWEELANKKLNPPYIPDVSENGLNYFDEEFTGEDIKHHIKNLSPEVSSASMNDQFEDFDYQESSSNNE